MSRRGRWLVLAIVVAVAAYVVLDRLGPYDVPHVDRPSPLPRSRLRAYDFLFQIGRLVDIHGFYQNMVYGIRTLGDGGRGWFWNPFQNCGQPFLGRIAAAQLYPPYLASFLIGGPWALWVLPFIHLVVAGVSAYLLCRELGAGRTAALCGALTFELGNATMETAVWQPHASGSYAWLPAAMLFCERALRSPTASNTIGLALALALALLAGFPQTVFYTCLLIGLRVLWELPIRRGAPRGPVLLAVGLALVLAPLVAGLQLIPAAEVGLHSVRGGALSPSDIAPGGALDWRDFRLALGARASVFQPFVLLPCLLAGAALLAPATRRRGLFYAVAGLVFFVLALGPTTPLLSWYLRLPLAALFRWPQRFMWLTNFCLAVVAGLGADALLSGAGAPGRWWSLARLVAMVAVLGAFHAVAADGLRTVEAALAIVALAVCLAPALVPGLRTAAGAILVGAVLLNLIAVPPHAWRSLLTSGAEVFGYAPTFTRLRARMTAQDRAYFTFDLPFNSDFGLTPKSASLFEVPTFFDYDPQVARWYAEFLTMLRTGAPMRGGAPPQILGGNAMPPGFNRRLLNLAAGRYVLAEAVVDNTAAVLQPPPALLEDDGTVRLYENPQALPRARYVPRVEVVADPAALLERLARGPDDPRTVALVEARPPSGFTGVEGNTAPGRAEFLKNDPEHLVVGVEAPAAGFLVLADQYFPGWEARVNGERRPIVRADHVFRLVEVPAGASRVEFRYAPPSVRLGAVVSGLTLLGMAAVLLRGRRRRAARA